MALYIFKYFFKSIKKSNKTKTKKQKHPLEVETINSYIHLGSKK